MLAFALTGGPYKPNPSGSYRMDAKFPDQPPWKALFGVPLKTKIEWELQQAARTVDALCERYWQSFYALLECNARLHLWIVRYAVQLSESGKSSGYAAGSSLAEQAERIVECGTRFLTVQAIARALKVSREHLCNVYMKEKGSSLGQYIRHKRIESAKSIMLANDKEPIREVARRCGYQSLSAFSHAFHTIVGKTPTQWRRESGFNE